MGDINKDEAAALLRKEGIDAVYDDMMEEAQYQFLNNDLLKLEESIIRQPTPRIVPTRPSWGVEEIPIRRNGGQLQSPKKLTNFTDYNSSPNWLDKYQ
ncbi:MAG: hypothetical protein H5T96_09770 [Tissierellales bacterium]|nr:hypothetical protein [Tissierellales bacterium]